VLPVEEELEEADEEVDPDVIEEVIEEVVEEVLEEVLEEEEVELEIISFDSVFKSNVRNIIEDLKNSLSKDDGLFKTSFFDSLLIQIDNKTISQNKLDFACLIAATDPNFSPGMDKKHCYLPQHMVELQLTENYAQDIFMSANKPNQIQQQLLIDKHLSVNSFSSHESSRYVGVPPLGMKITDEFDTLWSVVFSLSPEVKVNKEIWMVQD
jgi:hypothetical protein